MAITVNDLRFYKSERMTDFQDGGGQMTGNEIVSGVENQIFLDVSDVDRAAGDVSIRKIYAAVTSDDTSEYIDAGVVVFDEPDDPATSVLITSTGDFFDERAQIQSYIENYRIQGPRYFAWLFDLHIEGSRTLTFFCRVDDEAPPINTSLLLMEYTTTQQTTVAYQQYVRVIRILLDEVQEFTISEGGTIKRRIITVELSEALRHTFHGAAISSFDNLKPLAVVYSTMVADAAQYYGIRPLVQQADPGDTVIYADSIRGRLIPSSQIESPVTDVTAVGERTFAVPASLTTISFTVSDTFIPGFVLYAGRPIYPGTLVISISGGELVDDGGNLKSGQTSVGEVDYAQGVITFSILSPTYAGTKMVTFRPAAAISRASNCYAIPITDQTRFRAYVASLKPLPDPGTLIVDYLSSGNWYRLRDNGNGALTGASAAYGSGTVNFTSGSVSLSLGSYPDINSAILISWGSGADTRSLTQAPQALTFKVSTGRTGLVPGEQTLTWSGNTLTDQGDGTLTGTGGSGVIDYASGEIILTPTTIPAANTAMTFAGQQYAPASWFDESFTPTAVDGIISITLAHQAILPESIRVYYAIETSEFPYEAVFNLTQVLLSQQDASHAVVLCEHDHHGLMQGSWINVYTPVQTFLNGNYPVSVINSSQFTYICPTDYIGIINATVTIKQITEHSPLTAAVGAFWTTTWQQYSNGNIGLHFDGGGTLNASAGTFTLETDGEIAHAIPKYEYVAQTIQIWDTASNQYLPQLIIVQVFVGYYDTAYYAATFKPGSTVNVHYGVANTPVAFSDGLTLATGGLRFSLQPVTGEQIASGSVRLLIGDRVYQDVGSQMVYGWNSTAGTGTIAGSIDAASGQVILTDWPSATNSYTIEAMAIRIHSVPVTTVTFRTPTAPIAVGSFSFRVNRYQSEEVFEGSANAYGVISGNNVTGKFDYQTGVAMLTFGTTVVASQHTDKPWYATDFITTNGTMIAPNLVDLETLRYNCVTYVSMPLDASVIGIDPVRLPGDGLIPIYRTGQMALVHHTATHSENSLSPTQQVDMGRERLYRVVIEDANALRFPASFYSVNRETGIITMASDLNLTGYSAPYAFKHTIADLSVIMDTDLSGRLALTKAVSHTFPATTSRVSSLLYIGTLQARVTNVFEQMTWTGDWLDDPVGDPPLAQYDDVNYPIGVTNAGAYQDRFLIRFTSSTAFQVIGEQLGIIAEGTIAEDCSPINPLTGGTMFTLQSEGWGIHWSTGYCLRFNVICSAWPVDCIRAIQPSQPAGDLDQVELLLVGNVNA